MKAKTLVLLFLSLAMSVSLWGYSFVDNGIYYNILSGNTSVEVTYGNSTSNSYSGSVTIPSSVSYSGRTYSVTSIGYRAFYRCTGLTSVTIPNSVTSIGGSAFYECTGLTSVTIPNSVTSIGYAAFRGCTGLTSVTIPNSVTSIDGYAFRDCTGITAPIYNNTIFAYMPTSYSGSYTIPSGITTIVGGAFYGCTGLTSVTIPNSVTSIGDAAFYNCTGMTSVTIPNSVTSIADNAFEGCTGLTSVTIPNSVTSIGNYAFRGCTGLTSVTLPNSVTSIGYDAFYGCRRLTSVTLPNSVTSIADNAFWGCTGITAPIYNNTIFAYMPTSYSGSYTIPSGITTIAGGAFDGCTGLTSVTLPNSVTSIGGGAFDGCTGLTSVTLPNSVTSIGNQAFYRCSGLTSVTIPNSVTSIGHYAFYNTGITVPLYINTIFAYMPTSYSGSYTIPSGITTIAGGAFDGCTGLTSVTLPNSVTSIGDRAFYECTGLTSVYFSRSTPPTMISFICYGVNPTCYVPCGTTNAYRTRLGVSANNIVEYFVQYSLTALSSDSSLGTVTITQRPSSCQQQTAVIQAAAIPHYHFKQWSDGDTSNPRSVNVTSDTSLTAIFEIDRHTVSSNHDFVSGTGEYDYGTTVTLTAHSNEFGTFIRWKDGVLDSTRVFMLDRDTIMNAIYDTARFVITATCQHGTVTGSGTYVYPDVIVTLIATPDEGYRFVKWSDDNEYNPRVFVVREDLTVEAICEEAPIIDDVEDVQANTPAFYVIGTIVFNPSNEQLRVYSAAGKLLKSADADIDLSGYPAGIYMIVDSRGNAIKVPVR